MGVVGRGFASKRCASERESIGGSLPAEVLLLKDLRLPLDELLRSPRRSLSEWLLLLISFLFLVSMSKP